MNNIYITISVVIMTVVTMALRILPFVIFGGKKTPAFITFLGKYLPYGIMGMLVVYCLKNVTILKAPYGLPELISVGIVTGLHIKFRNTLLSIIAGTICYMLLIQFVFC